MPLITSPGRADQSTDYGMVLTQKALQDSLEQGMETSAPRGANGSHRLLQDKRIRLGLRSGPSVHPFFVLFPFFLVFFSSFFLIIKTEAGEEGMPGSRTSLLRLIVSLMLMVLVPDPPARNPAHTRLFPGCPSLGELGQRLRRVPWPVGSHQRVWRGRQRVLGPTGRGR
jgi:hypothetical protein